LFSCSSFLIVSCSEDRNLPSLDQITELARQLEPPVKPAPAAPAAAAAAAAVPATPTRGPTELPTTPGASAAPPASVYATPAANPPPSAGAPSLGSLAPMPAATAAPAPAPAPAPALGEAVPKLKVLKHVFSLCNVKERVCCAIILGATQGNHGAVQGIVACSQHSLHFDPILSLEKTSMDSAVRW
jgi:hypothetical protein